MPCKSIANWVEPCGPLIFLSKVPCGIDTCHARQDQEAGSVAALVASLDEMLTITLTRTYPMELKARYQQRFFSAWKIRDVAPYNKRSPKFAYKSATVA